MIPRSKPRASRDTVIDGLLDSGLWSNRIVSRLSVVGVRGYYDDSMGVPNQNDRGIYDDAVFVISPGCFESFNFNTDPSSYRNGIATLEAPQRVVYAPGYHGYGRASGHPAFRQASSVVVRRDHRTGGPGALGGGRFTDRYRSKFWINLHRGGRSTTSSAGCQTVHPDQWEDFYSLVRRELREYGHPKFTYYLYDGPIT